MIQGKALLYPRIRGLFIFGRAFYCEKRHNFLSGKQKMDFVFSFLTKEFSDAILKLDLIWNKNRGMNMIRNILEYLEKTAKRLPDKIAFSGAEGTITFAELEETAKRIGTYLTRFGGRSCPIAVMMQKTPVSVAAFLGAGYSGNFYTPIDEVSIPTGEIAKVEGTPMDFTTPHAVGERINDKFQQLIYGAGYDHCYVLNKIETGSLDLAATCFEPNSGRTMEVYTTEAGVQLYTGNWLNGFEGAHGATFPARSAICFEAQCFPDTPNKPHFPSATLLPGDEYQQVTIYKFGVEK